MIGSAALWRFGWQVGGWQGRAGVDRVPVCRCVKLVCGGKRDGLQNCRNQVVGSIGYDAVWKPEDPKAVGPQPSVTNGVFVRIVKGAVSFDNQAVAEADEVRDVAAERDLTAELQMFEASIAEKFPEEFLVEGGGVPHTTGQSAFECGDRHLNEKQIMNIVRRAKQSYPLLDA
ncbi:MAG: hypothetical protein JWR84_3778 [Caulobacter sp.]|nr:hypothetical protein [Caulobacter sp.]